MVHLLEQTLYHSVLRIAVCVVALALVFDSGLLFSSTENISNNTQLYLANAVGVNASVEPTEVNQLTARITELEGELQTRDREISVNLNNGNADSFNMSTFVLSVIVFILLVLIVLNFALDYLRIKNINATIYKESDSRTA